MLEIREFYFEKRRYGAVIFRKIISEEIGSIGKGWDFYSGGYQIQSTPGYQFFWFKFLLFSLVPPNRCCSGTSNYMKISSFHISSPTFVLYHPGNWDVVGGITLCATGWTTRNHSSIPRRCNRCSLLQSQNLIWVPHRKLFRPQWKG